MLMWSSISFKTDNCERRRAIRLLVRRAWRYLGISENLGGKFEHDHFFPWSVHSSILRSSIHPSRVHPFNFLSIRPSILRLSTSSLSTLPSIHPVSIRPSILDLSFPSSSIPSPCILPSIHSAPFIPPPYSPFSSSIHSVFSNLLSFHLFCVY